MATFGKVNRSAAFNPTAAFPLDARYYFESLTAAEAAAAGAVEVGSSEGTYFYGENVVVVAGGKATLYLIQPDKTLKEVGSVPVGDEKSITVKDSLIKIIGFDAAETGAQPRKKADGTLEWVKPDNTTVEGLQTLVSGLESDVETLQTEKANVADVYTKAEVDGKVSGVYHYKGTVANYAALPDSPATGDVYNVEAADAEHNVKAGDNLAWNGEAWDNLGGYVDLSAYATKTEVAKKVEKVDGQRLMTDAEGTKLAGIDEGAQVNVIDSVDETQFAVGEDKKLTMLDIAMGKVTGLEDALDGKVDAVEGSHLMTDAEGTKLAEIETKAQVNILETVNINGEALPISEKGVNIPVGGAKLGAVKSAEGNNNVTIAEDGTMSVPKVGVGSLTQDDGEVLILNGGSSAQ